MKVTVYRIDENGERKDSENLPGEIRDTIEDKIFVSIKTKDGNIPDLKKGDFIHINSEVYDDDFDSVIENANLGLYTVRKISK